MHRWLLVCLALIGLALANCGSEEAQPAPTEGAAPVGAPNEQAPQPELSSPFVSVKEGRFIDPQGRHAETMEALGLPTLIGEWGAYGGHPNTLEPAKAVVRQLERHLFSDTYWDFHKGVDRAEYFPALARPFPVAVAGALVRYESDYEGRTFVCTWTEDPKVETSTRIYVPSAWYPDLEPQIHLEPETAAAVVRIEGTQSRFLEISPGQEAVERTLTLTRRGFVHDELGGPLESSKVKFEEP